MDFIWCRWEWDRGLVISVGLDQAKWRTVVDTKFEPRQKKTPRNLLEPIKLL